MGKDDVEVAIAALETWNRAIDFWVLVFSAIVVIGVAGELWAGITHWSTDVQLRPLRAMQVRLHETELAQISRQTELLRNKNLDMEWAISPRILEQGLTSAALKPFAGTAVIIVSRTDFEPKRTAGQIRAMLSMAGWVKSANSIGPQQYPFFDGVVVHVLGDRTKAGPAADALVGILNANKITAITGYPTLKMSDNGHPDIQSTRDRSGPSVIIVEVGPKPLPDSMKLKPEDVPGDALGNKVWGNIEE